MAVMIVRYRDGDELHWGSVADEAPSKAADHVSVIPLDLDAKTTAELIANYDDGGFDLSADPMSVAATSAMPWPKTAAPVATTPGTPFPLAMATSPAIHCGVLPSSTNQAPPRTIAA